MTRRTALGASVCVRGEPRRAEQVSVLFSEMLNSDQQCKKGVVGYFPLRPGLMGLAWGIEARPLRRRAAASRCDARTWRGRAQFRGIQFSFLLAYYKRFLPLLSVIFITIRLLLVAQLGSSMGRPPPVISLTARGFAVELSFSCRDSLWTSVLCP